MHKTGSRTRNAIIALTVLATLAALPALAQGRRSMGPSRPTGPSPKHAGGLLGELIFPCQAACVNEGRDCGDTANATALSCIEGACQTEISAAQTACAEDRRSTECREAVGALAECGDACLDTRTTELRACREALMECREACESDE